MELVSVVKLDNPPVVPPTVDVRFDVVLLEVLPRRLLFPEVKDDNPPTDVSTAGAVYMLYACSIAGVPIPKELK